MRTSPRNNGPKAERDDDQPELDAKQEGVLDTEKEKLLQWAARERSSKPSGDKINARIEKSLRRLAGLDQYYISVFRSMMLLRVDDIVNHTRSEILDKCGDENMTAVSEEEFDASDAGDTQEVDPEDDGQDVSNIIRRGTRKDIKKWLREHAEELSAYDARMIAGLVVTTLLDKKACRRVLEKENDEIFLAYIRRRMQKCEIVEPVSTTVALPKDFEDKISGIELSVAERRALALFSAFHTVTDSTKERGVKPEGVIVATGNQDIDERNECPSCILSLEEKLKNSGVTISIKEEHGRMHYGKNKGKQNFRVVGMTIEF